MGMRFAQLPCQGLAAGRHYNQLDKCLFSFAINFIGIIAFFKQNAIISMVKVMINIAL
jgi:hypothetical protein